MAWFSLSTLTLFPPKGPSSSALESPEFIANRVSRTSSLEVVQCGKTVTCRDGLLLPLTQVDNSLTERRVARELPRAVAGRIGEIGTCAALAFLAVMFISGLGISAWNVSVPLPGRQALAQGHRRHKGCPACNMYCAIVSRSP